MKQKRIRCFLFILFILAALALACSCSLDTQEDGPTADLVAPAVDSVDPYDGEDSVSVVPSITIEFSEEVERVGAEQAFSLSDGASNVDGSISWSGNAMVFEPEGELEEFTDYSVEVLGGLVTDTAGNVMAGSFLSSFTTGVDTHAPRIIAVAPAHQSIDIPQSVKVEIEFSEAMDIVSAQQAFTISQNGSPVSGDFNWTGNTMRFRPGDALTDLATYRVELSTGATDDSGNPVAEGVDVSFTVGVVVDIAAGNDHSLIAMSGGTVKAWGSNAYGQLGSSSGYTVSTPVPVAGVSDAVAVAAGRSHSVALIGDGTIRCWGSNSEGQLGDGGGSSSSAPIEVSGVTSATAVDAGVSDHSTYGGNHTLALLYDGTVVAWGSNDYGQLGNDSTTDSNVPVAVTGVADAVAVAAGGFHSLALLSDGSIKAWGRNSYGQLGNGSTEDSTTPVDVGGITNAVAVAAGRLHSLALLSDGSIKAWGYGGSGQLGEGILTWRWSPVFVDWITSAVAISAGASHSAAILDDQTIESWGANTYGQIGCGGSASQYALPVTVSGISSAVEVNGGKYHTICVLSDGTVKSWGANSYGQLGNGGYDLSYTPVTVSGF